MGEIRLEFDQHIERESQSLQSKIIDRQTQILLLEMKFQDSQKELHHDARVGREVQGTCEGCRREVRRNDRGVGESLM